MGKLKPAEIKLPKTAEELVKTNREHMEIQEDLMIFQMLHYGLPEELVVDILRPRYADGTPMNDGVELKGKIKRKMKTVDIARMEENGKTRFEKWMEENS